MTNNKNDKKVDFGLPLSGGNTFSVYETLKSLLDNQYNDEYLLWLLYLRTHAYFVNYFKCEGDEEFKKIAPLFFSNLWNYGMVGITRVVDKLCVLTVSPNKSDGQGNILTGTGYLAQWLNGMDGINTIGNGAPKDGYAFKLNDKDYAYAKWGSIALSAWWFWSLILKKQIQILNAIYTNISWLGKKMKYENYGTFNEATAIEIVNALNEKSGVVIENKHIMNKDGAFRSSGSQFTELKMPNGSSGADAWDYLSRYENFWNKYMGRVSHNYEKSSHNISNEMEVNNHNYLILEEDVLRQLDICSQQLKERLNINVKFSPTVDLKAMESETSKGDLGDGRNDNNLKNSQKSV